MKRPANICGNAPSNIMGSSGCGRQSKGPRPARTSSGWVQGSGIPGGLSTRALTKIGHGEPSSWSGNPARGKEHGLVHTQVGFSQGN